MNSIVQYIILYTVCICFSSVYNSCQLHLEQNNIWQSDMSWFECESHANVSHAPASVFPWCFYPNFCFTAHQKLAQDVLSALKSVSEPRGSHWRQLEVPMDFVGRATEEALTTHTGDSAQGGTAVSDKELNANHVWWNDLVWHVAWPIARHSMFLCYILYAICTLSSFPLCHDLSICLIEIWRGGHIWGGHFWAGGSSARTLTCLLKILPNRIPSQQGCLWPIDGIVRFHCEVILHLEEIFLYSYKVWKHISSSLPTSLSLPSTCMGEVLWLVPRVIPHTLEIEQSSGCLWAWTK